MIDTGWLVSRRSSWRFAETNTKAEAVLPQVGDRQHGPERQPELFAASVAESKPALHGDDYIPQQVRSDGTFPLAPVASFCRST